MTKHIVMLIILLIAIIGGVLGYLFGGTVVVVLFPVFALAVGFYIGKRYNREC